MTQIFLISNDDGVHAKGLAVLAEVLAQLGTVYIVAPHRERSGASHSISLSVPLRLEKMPDRPYSKHVYSVTGTPADCVMMALDQVLPEKPACVLSGINRGANLGVDTLYSGTVGAAMEAAMMGVLSMAISSVGHYGDHFHYETAAQIARQIFQSRESLSWRPGTVLNLNVPALPLASLKGVVGASLGRMFHDKSFYQNMDPTGQPYYWLGPLGKEFAPIEDSDCYKIDKGFAVVTLLKPSFLDEEAHPIMCKNLETITFQGAGP